MRGNLVLTAVAITASVAAAQEPLVPMPGMPPAPVIKIVDLDGGGREYAPLLQGPPESTRMRSALVTLAPGRQVERRRAGDVEELLIVLEGEAEILGPGGRTTPVRAGQAGYFPPGIRQGVRNSGAGTLRYVLVSAGPRPPAQ
ncbi:MAG: cupin domain-containing protein [Acidobacteriota bacterium]